MNNTLNANKAILLIAAILLSLFLLASDSTLIVIEFILFISIYIQLPGLLFLFGRERTLAVSAETLLVSLFYGLGILIIEFLLLSALGLRGLFIILNPIIVVALLIQRYKRGSQHRRQLVIERLDMQFAGIMVITCMLTIIVQKVSLGNIDDCKSVFLYQDITWHIGNIASLSQGFPFYDFRSAGLKFDYHYFNDLIFGMFKYCFRVSATELFLKCTPLITTYVFTLSIYAFFKSISNKVFLGFLIFLCCGAADTYLILNDDTHSSLLNYHIFSNINGVAVALGAAIAVYLFYKRIYERNDIKKRELLTFAVLVFVMTGLKGPFAAVMLAAMAAASALQFIKDHNAYRFISVTLAAVCSFLIAYVFIITGVENLFKESNNNRAVDLSAVDTFSRSRYWESFSGMLNGDKVRTIVFLIAMIVIGGIIAAGVYHILFAAETVKVLAELIYKRTLPAIDVMVTLAAGWIGIGGFWLLSQNGFSQVYFLFIAVLFIVGQCLRMLENTNILILKRFFIILIIVNTVINGRYVFLSTTDIMRDDSEHFIFNDSQTYDADSPSILTHDEMEGLKWIRSNADMHSVIATDRLDLWSSEYPSAEDDCRCFYYSALAERPVYIEGFSYGNISDEVIKERLEINRNIYSDDSDTSQKAIMEAGVDYVVVSKRFNKIPESFDQPVFDNDEIAVFKVR